MALFVVHLIMTVLCQAVFFIVTATEGAAEQAAAPAGVFCQLPSAISNGEFEVIDQQGRTVHEERIPHEATANYQCRMGYELSPAKSSASVCFNGKWSPNPPECILKFTNPKVCPPPPRIVNGAFALQKDNIIKTGQQPQDEGETVLYWCNDGFELIGTSQLFCGMGGWEGKVPVCISNECGQPPHIQNGDFVRFLGEQFINPGKKTETMPEGSKVYYRCHDDYRLHDPDSQVLLCVNRTWIGNLPACDKRTHCDPPKDIEHGNWILQESYLSHMPEDTVYGIGSRIIFECQDHYHLIGPGTIECDVAGYWSGPAPICLPKDLYCDEPEHLEHGTFMCRPHSCNLFEIGTEVHFVCDAHYAPHPEDQLVQVCTLGGQWSGTPPRCLHAYLSEEKKSHMHINTGTLTGVIATSCGVLGLLLLVMLVVALQRRLNLSAHTLSHQVQSTPPTYNSQQEAVTGEEQDRVALIAFADGVQVVLPSYDEAVSGHTGPHLSRFNSDSSRSSNLSGRGTADYRPLPSIPVNLRQTSQLPPDSLHRDHHRNSIITTTSTNTRDNVSIAFGSVDTMNVSDGTSTTVTIGTYDSAGSSPSIAMSQRAAAGSITSSVSHGSIPIDGPAQ